MKQKFEIIEKAKRQAYMCFSGIAIPTLVQIEDDRVIEDEDYVYGVADHKRYIVSETLLKIPRSAMKESVKRKRPGVADRRIVGADDNMILKVGKPGSAERVAALAEQYAAIQQSGEEVSPFFGE